MEMIYYSKLYGLTLANYDPFHYLLRTKEGVSLIVKKDEDVGNIGEVFVDEVYGKLMGDIRGKIVIDVGASMGDSSIYFAKKGAKEIYAYEPDKDEFDLASKNIILNQIENVKLFNSGIGVGQVSICELIEQLGAVGLLKMDCEGCEFEAIESISSDLLSKLDQVVIEYHGKPARIEKKLTIAGFTVNTYPPWTYSGKTPIGYLTAHRNLVN